LGEYAQAEAGVVQVIDREAVARMAARREEGPVNILVDYDHFSYWPAGSSEAAGWIVGLAGREDGLWGQIRWTPEGEAAVRNGRYRYLSPAWRVEDCEGVEGCSELRVERVCPTAAGVTQLSTQGSLNASWRRVRPVRLHSAGLTNCPNLRGIAALSNRRGLTAGQSTNAEEVGEGLVERESELRVERGLTAKPGEFQLATERRRMTGVMSELGLGADASEESALAAVKALRNRVASAESGLAELAKTNALLLEGQVEADLERYKGRYKPAAREKWKAALLANREAALELLDGVIECGVRNAEPRECGVRSAECGVRNAECGVPAAGGQLTAPLHNRAVAGRPEFGRRGMERGADERQRAEVLAYKNRHECTFDAAWQAVKLERPELFAGR
jgi:phage I-like protein